MSEREKRYTEGMLHPDSLTGKNILVTGGGTGLGKSMSEYFLKLGGSVCIASRKMDVLEATARELVENTGGEVVPIECDIRDYDSVEKMIGFAHESFGHMDIVVNNAAGNFISPTERLSHRAFHIIIDIVLKVR